MGCRGGAFGGKGVLALPNDGFHAEGSCILWIAMEELYFDCLGFISVQNQWLCLIIKRFGVVCFFPVLFLFFSAAFSLLVRFLFFEPFMADLN